MSTNAYNIKSSGKDLDTAVSDLDKQKNEYNSLLTQSGLDELPKGVMSYDVAGTYTARNISTSFTTHGSDIVKIKKQIRKQYGRSAVIAEYAITASFDLSKDQLQVVTTGSVIERKSPPTSGRHQKTSIENVLS